MLKDTMTVRYLSIVFVLTIHYLPIVTVLTVRYISIVFIACYIYRTTKKRDIAVLAIAVNSYTTEVITNMAGNLNAKSLPENTEKSLMTTLDTKSTQMETICRLNVIFAEDLSTIQ